MSADDPDAEVQPAPYEWVCLQYRERFHLTHEQFNNMNPKDFYMDLQMLSVEAEVMRAKNRAKSRKYEAMNKKASKKW